MNDQETRTIVEQRLAALERRMTAACQRAGRYRSEITVVAVTKTIGIPTTALLPRLGLVELAENRPQQLWRKAAALPPDVHWHLVGHLQRNKIEKTLPVTTLIHSVDSVRLLQALDEEAVRQDRDADVLLEVNASGEAAKHGFAPGEVLSAAPFVGRLQRVRVQGLMTMAALQAAEQCRPTFALVRRLRDDLAAALGCELPHLSMGMSNDFEVAIEEGATLVRLGTVLFEGLK